MAAAGPLAIVWRYAVKPEHRAAFESVYGPSGDWARLFGRAEGYAGTELLNGGDGRYLTLDHWRREEDFRAFQARWAEEYRALDRRCSAWTETEEEIGRFIVTE